MLDSASRSPEILIVEDDPDVVKSMSLMLARRGYRTRAAAGPAEAWDLLVERTADVVLLDLNFGAGRVNGDEGLNFLARLLQYDHSLVVVIVTGHSGLNVAVSAMRSGAYDFVVKPWNNMRFAGTIEGALTERARRVAATGPGEKTAPGVQMLGESAAVERLRALIARVAPTETGILLHGPAGAGKSFAARAIHRLSRRAEGPLRVVNLAALERTGLEVTLDAAMRGAAGGTLVLDHLDKLPAFARGALAYVLEDPGGETRVIATARNPALLDGPDGPGGDIVARTSSVVVSVPPLAEREGDVLLLARHFLRLAARRSGLPGKQLSAEAEAIVASAHWPEEIRTLATAMERAAILVEGATIGPADLALGEPDQFPNGPGSIPRDLSLAEAERAAVEGSLRRHGFNVSRAAAELGLTRAALYRRMARHGL